MMRRVLVVVLALCAASMVRPRDVRAQGATHLVADSGRFLLDGRPFRIISGEMHYARVPREYWHERLRMARAMGLNTISTYVFWNYHETSPGRYDFSGQRDIAAYIRAAQQEGLHVILRPGPYVCAEWEWGGYPGWLLADTGIVVRSTDARFTAPAQRWLDRLGEELSPLLASHGGPIIAVQVENEYGSFDRDKAYMAWQLAALKHAGFGDALLYTADGDYQLRDGTLPELPAVVNFGIGGADSAFARLARFRPSGPLMSGEYWAGWFDQWGRAHESTDAARQTRELSKMLDRGYSVNLYMFHGGTTFGFMNGANIDNGHYRPQTSSYDYDAALDESGRPTPKFFMFRDAIAAHGGDTAVVPALDSTMIVSKFQLTNAGSLWSSLGTATKTDMPRSMETFGQSFGYIDYRTAVAGPAHGTLVIRDVRDYAQIYVDGALAGSLDRRLAQDSLVVDLPGARSQLDILVENSGRVNFGKGLRDERKGIATSVMLNGAELRGWSVFTLPMSKVPSARSAASTATGPAFYRGTFTAARPLDTFLDTRGWGKGTVWVNGHQLGRFWSIGPQQTLYVPGAWLKRGANEVVVFDLEQPAATTMQGLSHPIFDQLGRK